jgi:sulfite exporter TauE/SafE
MGLDLRLPIGLYFTILGVLLGSYGLVTASNTEMYKRSLNLNINLSWGVVLLVFGLAMLIPSLMDRRKNSPKK